MPFEIYTVIRRQIIEIAAANTKGILTLGFHRNDTGQCPL